MSASLGQRFESLLAEVYQLEKEAFDVRTRRITIDGAISRVLHLKKYLPLSCGSEEPEREKILGWNEALAAVVKSLEDWK